MEGRVKPGRDGVLVLERDELSLVTLYSYFIERFHGSVESLRDSTSSHITLGHGEVGFGICPDVLDGHAWRGFQQR